MNGTCSNQRQQGIERWLCQIYNARGILPDSQWEKFKLFCETEGFFHEPPMGQRVDGKDKWDEWEKTL